MLQSDPRSHTSAVELPGWPATRREVHFGRVVRCFADRSDHVGAIFQRAVFRAPDRNAIVADGISLSFQELDKRVDRVASGWSAAGLRVGERVAILVGNRPEFLIALLAAERIGLIVVPLNVRLRRPEIAYVTSDCEASAIVYDNECAIELPAVAEMPTVRVYYAVGGTARLGDHAFAAVGNDVASVRPHRPNEDDPFCIVYTSGTTGRPKGAILTHIGCIHSVLHYRYGLGLHEGEIGALAVPLAHVTGLIAIFLTMLDVAGTTIVIHAFRASSFLEIVQRERITYTLMVPAMYKLCLMDREFKNFDLSTWRIGGFGGAPMPVSTITELSKAVPGLSLSNIYGATETSSPSTILRPGFELEYRQSVGEPVPCAEILVTSPEGRELAPGAHGELLIGGPMVIPGYWNNPSANAASFIAGFWRSGDIGSKDAVGRVYVHDRLKDVINRGGYKIYCAEVEEAIMLYPGVEECAVVGVPDEVLGERVRAFVVADSIDPVELRKWCSTQLSDYKVPEIITPHEGALPRNPNGKVLKTLLR